ncbi:MAG: Membrane protein insertase YidC [Phycisphaerae bacterium]|nr:Membrane protein insertase YidC [Phycisphaerae bacterium]
MIAAVAVFIAYNYVINRWLPAPRQAAQPVSEFQQFPTEPSPADPTPLTSASAPATDMTFTAGVPQADVTIGGEAHKLRLELSQRGAAVARLTLTQRKKNGQYVHRAHATGNEPLTLLTPVADGDRLLNSFATSKVRLEHLGREFPLGDLVWQLVSSDPAAGVATYSATLRRDDGQALLELRKTYALSAAAPLVNVTIELINPGDAPATVSLLQDGAVGIPSDNLRMNMRRVFGAERTADGAVALKNVSRDELHRKLPNPSPLGSADPKARFLWTALVDKYYGIFMRGVGPGGEDADIVRGAQATVGAVGVATDQGDALARLVTRPVVVPPGGSVAQRFEICASPKDHELLRAINAAYVDPLKLNYVAVKNADIACACTFQPLPQLMTWLMDRIYLVVRNYGVAIIFLVVIIRTLLHPLAVFQQKSMYRMQEAMSRIQPKIAALKERYANDRMRLNQEMMKLWGEENVNPAASMVSFIPLFLQMPILVALWTALNTDIHLRNAPFDGWWIKDLSSPDALISFGGAGLTIPLLGILPMFRNIPALNVLPILMGVSMWLQQKYMPKPGMQARAAAAAQQPPRQRKPGEGPSPEDMMKQQQMMANMMSIMLPLMFYYMPSGLNLYWMATNVFGIFESIRIRRQLERDKLAAKERGTPPPRPKSSFMSRWFRQLAEQAEQLQKRADRLSEQSKK